MSRKVMLSSQRNLNNLWHPICSTKVELELPASRWKHQWSCNEVSAQRLYNSVRMLSPEVIVETGTFEAIGTFTLARAAHENNNGAQIFTIDYDGDPTSQLPQKEWIQLKKIREDNLELIHREFPGVKVTFIEGDSREVLPQLFPSKLGYWDFFYQDSMHFKEGILAEWQVMRKFSKVGSVVVFDDVALENIFKSIIKQILGRNNSFTEYFFRHEVMKGSWSCQSIMDARRQFWAQKVRG